MRLLPWQFGRVTPREFRLMCEGHARERDHQARLVIWQIQHRYRDTLRPRKILHGWPSPHS